MSVQHAEELAAKLNLFPEVAWDRWSGWAELEDVEPGDVVVISVAAAFGWIAREDGRSDFLVLQFWASPDHGIYETSFVTSSALYSKDFAMRLGLEGDHRDCLRIADDFSDVVKRVVRPLPRSAS